MMGVMSQWILCRDGCHVTVDIVLWWASCHGGHCVMVGVMSQWTLCRDGCHVSVDIVP